MNREQYGLSKNKLSDGEWGCIGVIGLGLLGCIGVLSDYQREQTVLIQGGENVYAFLCRNLDRKTQSCDTEENLQAVYENTTIPTWRNATTTWTMEPDSEWCAQTSYNLGQCLDLAPKREGAYEGYTLRKFEEQYKEQHKDDQFYRDLDRNNGM
ncbi:MAG TPA: hypothetical protein HA294_02240 [Nanoarchaeota archaeon]|nr:hypothetical protein [Candidatus Woesearchaeota archaeon]HIH58804.1 hypothetical protein [Nanoarchaeota archaeon]HIJ04848.1 hypothetical protein [Nanoarchaeota archaeon]